MGSSRVNYVAVGAFVLALLAGLIVAIIALTGRGGPVDRYHTVYDNVGGIDVGTQVLYEGFQIGQVERITPLLTEGPVRFRVDLSVRRGWRIPEDSVARVAASARRRAMKSRRWLAPW